MRNKTQDNIDREMKRLIQKKKTVEQNEKIKEKC